MRSARMAWAQCGSVGRRSEILGFVAHMMRGTTLDTTRVSDTRSGWFIGKLVLLGIRALTLHRGLLNRIKFGGFVLGALLPGDLGEHF
jgi:hypothetical protein